MPKRNLLSICCLLSIISILICGAILLLVSTMPPDTIKSIFDSLAADKSANLFDNEAIEHILFRMRLIGIVIITLSIVLFLFKEKYKTFVSHALKSSYSFLTKFIHHLIHTIKNERKSHLASIFIIIIISIIVRVFFLSQPMKDDEAFTFIHYASRPLSVGLTLYDFPNNHIFHTMLVHISTRIWGNDPWAIRMPALLAGVFLVVATYGMTRIFFNKHAALITAALIASSNRFIVFSTNARGYTMIYLIFIVLFILATYFFKKNKTSGTLFFIILSALGFYTIPAMLYPFGIVVMWIFLTALVQPDKTIQKFALNELALSLVLVISITFFLYIPVIIANDLLSIMTNPSVGAKTWSAFIEILPISLKVTWNHWNIDIPVWLRIILIIGFIISLIYHKRLSKFQIPILLSIIIVMIPLLMIQRIVTYTRIWLFLLPIYFTLASSGIVFFLKSIPRKTFKGYGLIFNILIVFLSCYLCFNIIHTKTVYYSDVTGSLRDAENISLFLKDRIQSDDCVIATSPSYNPLQYYFQLHGISTNYLKKDFISCNRIIIVVNETNNQNLENILNEKGIPRERLSIPKNIMECESATLYEMFWQ